jgi:hypothetical protein
MDYFKGMQCVDELVGSQGPMPGEKYPSVGLNKNRSD